MPEKAKNALVWAIVIALLILVAAIPFTIALLFGFAWGLIAVIAVAAVLYWLGGKAGMNGGFEIVFVGGIAAVVGLVAGSIWVLLW